MPISTIPEVISDLRQGRMIILVHNSDREEWADLVLLAEHVTPEAISFMAREARGLICMPMGGEICERLGLSAMVAHGTDRDGTAFTVSIDAAAGISTGISHGDKAHTIKVASDPRSGPKALVRPGSIFPVRAHHGGVLGRGGQAEGAVDLASLAGSRPAAVICEVVREDGQLAPMADLKVFSEKHGIRICTGADLFWYRIS